MAPRSSRGHSPANASVDGAPLGRSPANARFDFLPRPVRKGEGTADRRGEHLDRPAAGLVLLNGGDEFHAGNEPQDRAFAAVAGRGPAYVLTTAAGRQGPDRAAANAVAWFGALGLGLSELRVRSRTDAQSTEVATLAAGAGGFYLVGGDPGLVARTLAGSRVWAAMLGAWADGAAMAGSSAGAMALCEKTLVMDRWPHHEQRRAVAALGLVPRAVVIPHFGRFGARWTASDLDPATVVVGLDERTAAVWDGGAWRAEGAGGVTVGAGPDARRYAEGAAIEGIPAPTPA
ncbi:MAG: Type 1 glutamine amidotransferase-like domain-containing protein [Candidatus Dormibacteraeota bacterium]|nr:Type 1 glutamine amidotransferase-like domain-containing protein [Candidatus Dormibacteraeota bacterium]